MGQDGSVFILDGGDQRILVFSPDGSFRQSIGRRGSGPGEFRNSHYLTMYGDTLSVYDGSLRRAALFRTDGTFVNSFSSPLLPRLLRTIEVGPAGELICIHRRQVNAPPETQLIEAQGVLILSASGDSIATIETPRVQVGSFTQVSGGQGSAFTAAHFIGYPQAEYVPGRGIYITAGGPWIRWYDLRGNLTLVVMIDQPRDPVTQDERDQLIRSLDAAVENAPDASAAASARRTRELLDIPDTKDYWDTMDVDEYGYIWARIPSDYSGRVRLRPDHRVFSPTGEYLGDTTWPDDAWIVSRGHLLLIRDYTTNPIPVVYRIRPAVRGLRYP